MALEVQSTTKEYRFVLGGRRIVSDDARDLMASFPLLKLVAADDAGHCQLAAGESGLDLGSGRSFAAAPRFTGAEAEGAKAAVGPRGGSLRQLQYPMISLLHIRSQRVHPQKS